MLHPQVRIFNCSFLFVDFFFVMILFSNVALRFLGSLGEKVKSWSDHQDNLSSNHRGLKQFKGVRTAEWLVDGARDAVLGAAGRAKRKGKMSTMEKEA